MAEKHDILFEKITTINSNIDLIVKKLDTLDNRQDELQVKVAKFESFFKGMSLLITAVVCLIIYIYSQDKNVTNANDDKHDHLFQILQERIIKIEERVKE